MSLITPDFGLLFWMTLIFAILFFVLAKFGFPLITSMVNKRSERIAGSIRMAKEAELKLAEMAEQQAKMLEETRAEQARILKEASQARDSIIAQAKAQAQDETQKMLAHARTQIAAEKESALRDIRREVAVLSVNVAEKVLRKELGNEDKQMELVSKMVDEVARLS